MNMFDLTGKVALVTGASYGIGYAIAKGLHSAGATIVFNDINQELVDRGLAAYEADGIKAYGYVCDVTDEDAVMALVQKVKEDVGVIDILVNNAGIIKRIPMTEMSAADFRKVIDVDLNAPFICAKAVLPGMIETPLIRGHAFSDSDLQEYMESYPLKRFGTPDEVAYAVIYLLSDASIWVTGTSLVIDGGISLK